MGLAPLFDAEKVLFRKVAVADDLAFRMCNDLIFGCLRMTVHGLHS